MQSVAVELKERRVECRDLTAKNLDLARESSENEAKVYELRSENDRLKSLNSKLQDENQGLSANQGGYSSEMMKLQSLNVELENKVQELRTSLEDSDKKANIFAQEAMSLRCSLDEKIKAAKEESEEILDSYKRKAQVCYTILCFIEFCIFHKRVINRPHWRLQMQEQPQQFKIEKEQRRQRQELASLLKMQSTLRKIFYCWRIRSKAN